MSTASPAVDAAPAMPAVAGDLADASLPAEPAPYAPPPPAAPYAPRHKVRIVTAASLFDGHDAAINSVRRIPQVTDGACRSRSWSGSC